MRMHIIRCQTFPGVKLSPLKRKTAAEAAVFEEHRSVREE